VATSLSSGGYYTSSTDDRWFNQRYNIYKKGRKEKYGEDWPSMKPVVADNKKKMKCGICRKTSKIGEVFLATNKVDFGWIGFHKRCVVDMAEKSDMHDYEIIKQRILDGQEIF
jgi:hypothetical protein